MPIPLLENPHFAKSAKFKISIKISVSAIQPAWHKGCNQKGQKTPIKPHGVIETDFLEDVMDVVVATYGAYVAISVFLTVWVARTLHKNGRVFLVEVFNGDESLADSVNHLLVVGFYLINLGYVSLALKIGGEIGNTREGIEALSWKIGMVLIVLGGMHFFNLLIFQRIHRKPKFFRKAAPAESVVQV